MSEAKITLTATDATKAAFDSVRQNLDGLKVSAEGVKATLAGLGVTAVALGMEEMIRGAIEAADQIDKMSQRTGIAAERLSEMQFAAKGSDVSTDSLAKALKNLNVSISEGLAGDQAKATAFRNLGISLRDANGQAISADKAILKLADTFSTAKDSATKTAYAVELMGGKVGDEMIPFLNAGGAAIEEMMGKARALGLTISTDFAHQADEFNNNLMILHATSQKLVIELAGDFVAGVAKAGKAMADAAVEGGKFQGVLAGLQTLFTGDDQYKTNVKIVETTDQLLAAQNRLDRARAEGDTAAIKRLTGLVAGIQQELGMYQRLGQAIDDQKKKEEDSKPKKEKDLKPLDKTQAGQQQMDALLKQIEERTAAGQKELDLGRQITEAEKFETKVVADLTTEKSKLSAAQRQAVLDRLEEYKATDLRLQQQKQELAMAGQLAKEVFQEDAEMAAFEKSRADERDRVNRGLADQAQGLKDSNEQMQLEASLLGATDQERAVALQLLVIEQQRKAEILKLNQDLLLTEQARNAAIDQVNANAAEASRQALAKKSLQDQIDLMGRFRDLGKQVWDDLWSSGHDRLKRLGDDIKQFLLDQLYKLIERQWVIPIFAQITGSGVGQAAMSAVNGNSMSGIGNLLGGGNGGLFGGGFNFGGDWSLSNVGTMGQGVGGFLGFGGSGVATSSTFNAAMDSQLAYSSGAASATTGALGSLSSAIPYVGALFAASQKQYGAAAGMAIGTAIMPGIGTAIGYIAGTLVDSISKSHGPKQESAYGTGVPTKYTGDASAATQLGQSIQQQYTQLATALGVTDATLSNLGVFISKDANGTAKTQLEIHGGNFSRAALNGGKIENVGRSDAEFNQAVQLAIAQLDMKNLQSAVGGKIGDYLKGFGVASSSLDTLNQALQVAQDVAAFDKSLEALGSTFQSLKDASVDTTEQFIKDMGGIQNASTALGSYYNNYYTDAEKRQATAKSIASTLSAAGLSLTSDQILGMSRADFRALTDAASASPASKLYESLLQVNQAFADITPAAQDASSALGGASDALAASGKSLWEFVRGLGVTRAGTASPQDQLTGARAAYIQDLSLAKGGNVDAYGRLSDDATGYIDAAKLNYSSGTATQAIIDQVMSEISALPAVKSYDQQQLDQLGSITQSINQLGSTVTGGSSEVVGAITTLTGMMQSQLNALIAAAQATAAAQQQGNALQAAHAQVTDSGTSAIVDAVQQASSSSGQWVGSEGGIEWRGSGPPPTAPDTGVIYYNNDDHPGG